MPRLKLLLDECVDRRLAAHIPDHTVKTAPEMGWAGLSNGDLLQAAQSEFDVFLSSDRNLPHQQNLPRFNLAVVILEAPTNRLGDILPLIPDLLRILPELQPGEYKTIGS